MQVQVRLAVLAISDGSAQLFQLFERLVELALRDPQLPGKLAGVAGALILYHLVDAFNIAYFFYQGHG